MSDHEQQQLAAEMAAISAVKSTELVEAAQSAGELNAFQQQLDESFDRVQDVKRTLQNVQAYQVTPELAVQMDADLTAANVVIPVAEGASMVEGAESLGRTLMPRDFLLTRLTGCENFLSDFFKNSREVVQRIGSSFKDSYVIFTESQESLNKSLDILENAVVTHQRFDSKDSFILTHRLFNLFKINGKVDGNWVANLAKLNSTLNGLSNNYYLNSRKSLDATYSYFGGFNGLNQEQAESRLKELPVAIPSVPFKECTYPDNQHGGEGLSSKRSVELMGGAYFFDVRQKRVGGMARDLGEVEDWITRYLEFDRTGFENNAEYDLNNVGFEIKALTSDEIKGVIRQLRATLKDWAKIFEQGERFRILDNDYTDVVKGFLEADVDEDFKSLLAKHFAAIARKNQMELLMIRAAVSNYLTLIVNGLVAVCNDSIEINAV